MHGPVAALGVAVFAAALVGIVASILAGVHHYMHGPDDG